MHLQTQRIVYYIWWFTIEFWQIYASNCNCCVCVLKSCGCEIFNANGFEFVMAVCCNRLHEIVRSESITMENGSNRHRSTVQHDWFNGYWVLAIHKNLNYFSVISSFELVFVRKCVHIFHMYEIHQQKLWIEFYDRMANDHMIFQFLLNISVSSIFHSNSKTRHTYLHDLNSHVFKKHDCDSEKEEYGKAEDISGRW